MKSLSFLAGALALARATLAHAAQPVIGVVVHPGYGVARTLSKLQAIGVSHVRLDAPWNATDGTLSYATSLARTGIKLDLIVNGWQGQPKNDAQLGYAKQLLAAVPGSVEAIEGPNEVNNNPQSMAGITDAKGGGLQAAGKHKAAPMVQSYLYAAVKADPAFAGVRVIDYTDEHAVDGPAAFSNMHCYASDNAGVDWWIAVDGLGKLLKVAGARPYYVTEWGDRTDKMSETLHAQLTLQGMATSIQAGAAGYYIYALQDDAAGPWGLFKSDGTPKAAVASVSGLTALLADKPGAAPKPLTVTLKDPIGTVQQALVSKSDGSYVLLFWTWHAPVKPITFHWVLDRTLKQDIRDVAGRRSKVTWSHPAGQASDYVNYAGGVVAIVLKP